MKKILRYTLRIGGGLIGLLLSGLITIWLYVIFNKPSILRKVTTELNKKVRGKILIADIDPSFFHTFPYISVRFSKVIIHDSLWQQHHHNLLEAEKIFARLNIFSIFSGQPTVNKILIEEGSLYMFSDSTGYSNTDIFYPQKSSTRNSKTVVPDIGLKNIHLVIVKEYRKKLFDFNIQRLNCDIQTQKTFLLLNINMVALISTMAFNTDNGSFLEEKQVAGKIKLQFNPASKVLQFNDIVLQLNNHPFTFTGKFFLGETPPPFLLSIQTEKINYKQVIELLSGNISKKMDRYDIENPITIHATIDGTSTDKNTPLINIKMIAENNIIKTPAGSFISCSFKGSFSNELKPDQRRTDENSGLRFTSFSGNWENILLKSENVTINNLVQPVLSCDLHSTFDLPLLNDLSGSKTIQFNKGSGTVDIVYKGPIQEGDSMNTNITGNISLDTASINYLPRKFLLTNCNGKIRFKDKDLYIDDLLANAGGSQLKMNGSAKNLLSFIDKTPEKLVFDWGISSPKLNLQDFTSFLGKQSVVISKKNKKAFLVKTTSQIDHMLKDCIAHLQLKANQLTYKKFLATNARANVELTDKQIILSKGLLEHAGGSLTLTGTIQDNDANNFLSVKSHMDNVDITKVFSAFNNFGQTAILDKNLKGKLNADINITGLITGNAEIVENSLKGTIDFSVKDGQLIQFEPVKKISQTAFKNRDFSDIQFAELKDKFELNGTVIKINRMEIQSTAMTMFVEGLYDIKKGADMSIQIPLNNIKARKEETIPTNKGIYSKTGISLRLHAKTSDDGKLNITWDPFKKALKKIRGHNKDQNK